MRAVIAALVLAGAVGFGCSDERSPRCKEVCQRGDQCAEALGDPNFKFDEGECTAACGFLEQDKVGKQIVDEYVTCVRKATTCEQVIACE